MIHWIKNTVFTGFENWNSFWFKPLDTLNMACFRFCFCLSLLVFYLVRFLEVPLFFHESGLLTGPSATALNKIIFSNKMWFDLALMSDTWLYLCYLLFIFVLFLMVLGFAPRVVTIMAFALHLVFIQQNPTIIFGADTVATFWLFYLMFANSNNQIKWLNFFLNKKPLIPDRSIKGDWLNTMAVRFIQIQLSVIYLFSGLEKLKGQSWWTGSAIWEALSFYDFTLFDFSFLLGWPVLSSVLALGTVLFEIYFPVLVWLPKLRALCLWSGLALHVGIALGLNIYFFSAIMLASYLLFIPSDTLRFFIRRRLRL